MDKKSRVQKNWKLVIILSLVLFITIITQDVVREIVLFNNDVSALRLDLQEQTKLDLEEEVDFRVSELQKLYEDIDDDFNEHLEISIDSLVFSVERTIELSEGLTTSEIEANMFSTINDFSSQDIKHNYYLIKTDGTLIYDGDLDVEPNVNIIDNADDFNRLYIEELLSKAHTEEYGEVTAYFGGEDSQNMGYVGVELENEEYVIYTIGDINRYLNISLENYYDELSYYYGSKEKSIFIMSTEGVIYFQRNEEFEGKLYSEIDDVALVETAIIVLDKSRNDHYGFVTSEFYKNQVGGEISERIIFIKTIDEMELIVGYSSDTLQNDQIIDQFVTSSIIKNVRFLVPIYLVMVVITIIVVKLIVSNNKTSAELFKEEEELYHIFSDISEDIILITNKKGYIIFANKLGNEIIFENELNHNVNLDDIMVDEEGYKVLLGLKENYYIKYSVSHVKYDGEQCDLYIVNDVTEKVKTERKLEAMTLSDDLTGLGNRRLLVRDYNDFILPHIKDGNKAFLAMIDLDNFKQANDIYGHSYGDDVLIMISDIFKSHENENIKIYRVGGDEFSMLVINHTNNEVLSLLRKMKNKVSTHKYGKKVNLGFSAGVSEINIKDDKRRLSDYYEKADELLYGAKSEGKDRIKI